jgi:predicted MFS family arabinose efflux permease
MTEGFSFLWKQPFLRMTSLLVGGVNLVEGALYLTVIVIARASGATSAQIGLMFGLVGVAGLLGSAVAPRLAKRLSLGQTVMLTLVLPAMMLPLFLVVNEPIAMGLIYGMMFVFFPTWVAVVGSYRILVTPDELQGRVNSVAAFISVSPMPLSFFAVGFMLEYLGTETTLVILAVLMALVALSAVVSRAIREGGSLQDAQIAREVPPDVPSDVGEDLASAGGSS